MLGKLDILFEQIPRQETQREFSMSCRLIIENDSIHHLLGRNKDVWRGTISTLTRLRRLRLTDGPEILWQPMTDEDTSEIDNWKNQLRK
jgi:hypothetical protein